MQQNIVEMRLKPPLQKKLSIFYFADVDGDSCAPNPCAMNATCVDLAFWSTLVNGPEGKVWSQLRMYAPSVQF